ERTRTRAEARRSRRRPVARVHHEEKAVKTVLKILTATVMLLTTLPVAAQDGQTAPAPNKPAPTVVPTSLKVSLVFSRYQGEKKISSVPHTLWVTTGDRTSLRLGTQIPVPTTVMKEGTGAVQSYNYRDVGTNIDCSANALPDGAYRLNITITDSSVYYPDQSD